MNDKFDYFIERTEKDIDELKSSNKTLHDKMDILLELRWRVAGAAAAGAFFISVAVSLVGYFFKR